MPPNVGRRPSLVVQQKSASASLSVERRGSSSRTTTASSAMETTGLGRSPSRSGSKKQSPNERLQRSRERNRMHARKTRQRKKEHMQNLQDRADELKEQQIRLRQTINEKNTASILVGLFSIKEQRPTTMDDPKVENLLRRPVEQIPDSTKIPELPALILPGHHSSRRSKSSVVSPEKRLSGDAGQFPDDGIDYELLRKDRSKCTPAELDQIRRERNRMHAKRTRDRKRLFMEEMEGIIKTLETENEILKEHLRSLGGDKPGDDEAPRTSWVESGEEGESDELSRKRPLLVASDSPKVNPVNGGQIMSLLEAAGAFQKFEGQNSSSEATAVSASDCSEPGDSFSNSNEGINCKRRRVDKQTEPSSSSSHVPMSITTAAAAAVGC